MWGMCCNGVLPHFAPLSFLVRQGMGVELFLFPLFFLIKKNNNFFMVYCDVRQQRGRLILEFLFTRVNVSTIYLQLVNVKYVSCFQISWLKLKMWNKGIILTLLLPEEQSFLSGCRRSVDNNKATPQEVENVQVLLNGGQAVKTWNMFICLKAAICWEIHK